ncbi:MAG: hypothetical protein OXR72_16470 [Gemmatimonadota bacterium]|nr:hypothetical protein [Gemmatimonadota bacterium]
MMNARFYFALLIVSSLWACGGDSVTTPEQPALERGLHEVGNLTRPRYWHAATLLQNGKVLIAGGLEELPVVLEGPPPPNTAIPQPKRLISAEIFDPETGISTPTGDLAASRSEDHGILLPDGRVLIIPGNPNLPIERYDAHSGRFNPVAVLPGRIGILTATLLLDGKVFLTSTLYAGVFDPTTGPFSPLLRMDPSRIGHTATLLKDGRVLIVGGQNVGRDAGLLGRNLIYDPSTEALSEAGNLQFDRRNHKAVLLDDGRVLIIGGGGAGRGPFVQTAEIYDPEANTFSPAGVSTIDPSAALLLPSGDVFLIRSYNGDIVLYDPATHTFSNTGYSISPRRSFATATLLEDGRVMVAGGIKWRDDNHDWESITDQIFIFTP